MALGGSNVSAAMLDELTGEQVAALPLSDLRALQGEVDIAIALSGKAAWISLANSKRKSNGTNRSLKRFGTKSRRPATTRPSICNAN
jgi:hypothetical protein